MQPELSILIVSWNVWPLLRACLASIQAETRADAELPPQLRRFGPSAARPADATTVGSVSAASGPALSQVTDTGPTIEVIVVDNASRDETEQELPLHYPWVRVIQSGENLGFTGGNNLAYAHAQGRYIYFLNPDTELIPGPQGEPSLWTLYHHIESEPGVKMVAPRLLNSDRTVQNNRRRFPTRITGFFESTRLHEMWRNNSWVRHMHMRDWPDNFSHDIDWAVGAAMLARRDALEAIREPGWQGPFDETFFMYSEEVDLCLRLKQQGGRIVFVPDAQVIHHEGQSSGQVVPAQVIRFNRSKVYYQRKHFGPFWGGLLRQYLLLDYRVRLVEEWLKWLVGHKRTLRAERMARYRQVLRHGLRVK